MKSLVLLFLLLFTFSKHGLSQSDTILPYTDTPQELLDINERDKVSLGLIVGWHQFRFSMIEVGIGFASSDFGNHGNMFRAVSLSTEIYPWKQIYGCKISVWKSIPMIPLSLGLNGVYYRRKDYSDWTVRPMLGVGFANFHLTYAYDITIGNREIIERNSHMLSVRYYIPVIKLNK